MAPARHQHSSEMLTSVLKEVSRTFYRTLRVLPPSIRPQISLAYLLARTTDTIADTGIVPVQQRLAALGRLRERISGATRTPVDFGELALQQGSAAERLLLERCEETLALLDGLDAADLQRLRDVLAIITSGQETDLRLFGSATGGRLVGLASDKDLDDYTYRVAGCVGEYWTKMCRARVFPRAKLDDDWLLSNGVRFGKGLQLVNILRDIPADLRNGRCYFPAGPLRAAGLSAEDLLEPRNEPRFRPAYNRYLERAEGHLAAGWAYTTALPWGCARVRLACAWPLLIGIKTVRKLQQGNVLDPAHRIKISRPEVKRLIARSVLLYPWPGAWKGLYSAAAR
jgi:farnesyl-diphosphate farnesyltransferase